MTKSGAAQAFIAHGRNHVAASEANSTEWRLADQPRNAFAAGDNTTSVSSAADARHAIDFIAGAKDSTEVLGERRLGNGAAVGWTPIFYEATTGYSTFEFRVFHNMGAACRMILNRRS
jgi:hypothetical protein